MGPYGVPAGTVGARGVDLGPYFQNWQMRNQAQQWWHGQQQQQQQFAREMAFRETAQRAGQALAELELNEKKADRMQTAGLAQQSLGQKRRELEAAERRDRAELSLAGQAQADRRAEAEKDRTERETVRARQEEIRQAEELKQTEELKRKDAERAQAEAEKERIKAVKLKVADFEANTINNWRQILRQQGWTGSDLVDKTVETVKSKAALIFENDPDGLMAALDAVDRWQAEQQKAQDREMALADKQRKAAREDEAWEMAKEDRERERADKLQEQNKRVLSRAMEKGWEVAIQLNTQADELEAALQNNIMLAPDSPESAQIQQRIESLRAQAAEQEQMADKIAQKLGLYSTE